MRLKIDGAVHRFVLLGSGDARRYYIANLDSGILMLVVCRSNLDLHTLAGRVVDANVGTESGVAGFVWEEDIGKDHTKLTIYRGLHGQRYDRRLSDIAARAPRRV